MDIAIVSNLSNVITVHEVHNVPLDDDQLLLSRSINILKEKFGLQFIGIVDCMDDILVDQVCVSLPPNENYRLDVYKKVEKTEGWLKYKTTEIIFLGSIYHQKVGLVLSELKQQYNKVTSDLVTISTERSKHKETYDKMKTHLEHQLDAMSADIYSAEMRIKATNQLLTDALAECETLRTQLANRDIEYRRLIRENASLCVSASQDTETIIKLNNEIGKLRGHIRGVHQVNEVNYSPDYSSHTSVNSSPCVKTPKESKSIPDARYDLCINDILTFDRSKLRSSKLPKK